MYLLHSTNIVCRNTNYVWSMLVFLMMSAIANGQSRDYMIIQSSKKSRMKIGRNSYTLTKVLPKQGAFRTPNQARKAILTIYKPFPLNTTFFSLILDSTHHIRFGELQGSSNRESYRSTAYLLYYLSPRVAYPSILH